MLEEASVRSPDVLLWFYSVRDRSEEDIMELAIYAKKVVRAHDHSGAAHHPSILRR